LPQRYIARFACYHLKAFDLWANTENHDRGSPLRRRPPEHERKGFGALSGTPLECIATDIAGDDHARFARGQTRGPTHLSARVTLATDVPAYNREFCCLNAPIGVSAAIVEDT
jgi:hypothetical protein